MADADALLQALDALAELVAAKVAVKLTAGTMPGYVDQGDSALGRRRHINAIRSGALPGVVLGRRYLARVEDIERFIAKASTTADAPAAGRNKNSTATDPVDALAEELGFTSTKKGRKPR